MFVYRGDIGRVADETVDLSRPLLITSAGNIRPRTVPKFYTVRPRGQRDYQLIYVANGCMHFYFDGETETVVEQGNMVLFRPGDPQIYYVYPKEKGEFFWVHFTGSDVEERLEECGVPSDGRVFWAGISSDVRGLYCGMIRELQTKSAHYEEMLQMTLRHLFLLIHRHLADTQDAKLEFQGDIIQALGYFERHWNESISIEGYALHNRMTPCWFRQKFKEYTGCSPLQYLLSLRISRAMNLLEHTDYNITQISYAVGYENVSYFRRLFQKHTGMTPGEYQRSRRKK